MKRYVAAIAMSLLLVAGVASYAIAAKGNDLRAPNLTGYEENPDLSTTGHGNFTATVNDQARTITYELFYGDLEGAVTQAHIHFAKRAVNGGISAFLCSNLDNPPPGTPACPAPGGTVQDVITAAEVIGPTGQGILAGEFEELVAAIRAGHAYVNVHSDKYPGGEIRRQIRVRGN